MAEIKKEQQRDELHRAIWAIADELRGSVDGWDFKNYVLGMMFYRYISESLTNFINENEIKSNNLSFNYADLADEQALMIKDEMINVKGCRIGCNHSAFCILPSELFCNVRKRPSNIDDLNETLERVFNHIEDSAKGSSSESDFAGLFG